MADKEARAEYQRLLERLGRGDLEDATEDSVVASSGAKVGGWPVEVKSNSSYNVYNVRAVTLGAAGDEPTEIADQMQAFNLAESFTATGSLAAGTYVVMMRVGAKNFFYATP